MPFYFVLIIVGIAGYIAYSFLTYHPQLCEDRLTYVIFLILSLEYLFGVFVFNFVNKAVNYKFLNEIMEKRRDGIPETDFIPFMLFYILLSTFVIVTIWYYFSISKFFLISC